MDYYYETESDYEFVKKTLSVVFNSVFFIIFLGFLLFMPLAMTYVGVKHLMDCPIQPKIPIYLFVGGAWGLVKMLQTLYDQWRKRRKEQIDQGDLIDVDGFENGTGNGGSGLSNSNKFIDIIISLFLFIWFCFGNYWVLSIWKPNFKQPREHDSQNWCSRETYMVAVVHIITVYILALIFSLLCIILFLFSKIREVKKKSENENNASVAEA